jgi:hypothetical protein
MKRITIALALGLLLFSRSAHADTLDFSWQSTAWTRTYESPTQASVSGPFTLSGSGPATFAGAAGGGMTLQFDGGYGTLMPSGDGTFNGPLSFRTAAEDGMRSGLGVLTETATGFTIAVQRAASGPDAGAAFVGTATRSTVSSVTAAEPLTFLVTLSGLVAAAVSSRRRRQ